MIIFLIKFINFLIFIIKKYKDLVIIYCKFLALLLPFILVLTFKDLEFFKKKIVKFFVVYIKRYYKRLKRLFRFLKNVYRWCKSFYRFFIKRGIRFIIKCLLDRLFYCEKKRRWRYPFFLYIDLQIEENVLKTYLGVINHNTNYLFNMFSNSKNTLTRKLCSSIVGEPFRRSFRRRRLFRESYRTFNRVKRTSSISSLRVLHPVCIKDEVSGLNSEVLDTTHLRLILKNLYVVECSVSKLLNIVYVVSPVVTISFRVFVDKVSYDSVFRLKIFRKELLILQGVLSSDFKDIARVSFLTRFVREVFYLIVLLCKLNKDFKCSLLESSINYIKISNKLSLFDSLYSSNKYCKILICL